MSLYWTAFAGPGRSHFHTFFLALRTSGVRRACLVSAFSVSCSIHTGLRTWGAASVPSSVLMPLHKPLAAFPSRFVLLFSARWAWCDYLHDSVTARLSLCRVYEKDVSVLPFLYGDGLFSASKRRSVRLEATGAPPPPTLPPLLPRTRLASPVRVTAAWRSCRSVPWLCADRLRTETQSTRHSVSFHIMQ